MKQNVAENIEEQRNNLRNYFLNIAPKTNVDDLNELLDQFTLDKFSKKQLLYKAGGVSDTLYFIYRGLLRIYYIKEDKEITNLFVPENQIVIGAYSILTGERNYSNYEAFEDTYVLKLKYSVMEEYYLKYHSLEHLGRKLVERYYTSYMKKTYDVLFLSAEERYQIFMKEQSDLMNRVPLRYIASYLGVKQETLSRLRAKY